MATIIVDRMDDVTAADGQTTLREAIAAATSGDEINFANSGAITLTQGQLEISTNLTIDGDVNGDDSPDVVISGNNLDRVFEVVAGTSIIDAVTVTGGRATTGAPFSTATEGGGIRVAIGAALTVVNSTIEDNTATGNNGWGGGIYSSGTLVITSSTVSSNTASGLGGRGGGVYANDTSTLAVTNSTITGNVAGGPGTIGDGGGIRIDPAATATIVNSTISGNDAGQGGGITVGSFPSGNTTITNSTISGNRAQFDGGGIWVGSNSTVNLNNSIVAGNESTDRSTDDLALAGGLQPASAVYGGVNVFSQSGVGDAQDILETTLTNIFAAVGSNPDTGIVSGILATNGGSVQTIAIASGGVAADAGDDSVLPPDAFDLDGDANTTETIPFDGRGVGFDRVVGTSSDIGAFEIPPDQPADAMGDTFSTDEATAINGVSSVFADNGSGADTDPDSPLTVTMVNGNASDVGNQITLPSGAELTLNADGTFTYDPNGAFSSLAGPASGASNQSAMDSFTYELNGDDTATVSITINGLDSEGDILAGTAAGELLLAGIGSDTINADDGDDILLGQDGDDTLNGGEGLDLLLGGQGADVHEGGAGEDTAHYANSTAVMVDLTTNTGTGGEAEGDTFSSVENVRGSTQDDEIIGDAETNILIGLSGDDLLQGMAAADTLVGNAGNDTASYSASDSMVTVNIGNVIGSGGHAQDDVLVGIEDVTGSAFDDILRGGLSSAPNPETDNVLSGLGGDDQLLGDEGNDTLFGGAGMDVMTGGADDDSFLFDNLSSDVDVILDFDQNGDDVLTFTGFGPGFDYSDFQIFNVNDTTADGIDNGDAFVTASGWSGNVVVKNAFTLVDAGDFVFM
ncbi:MAG: beta strand repeat-containing protein [Rhizobiaceae bacterium]